jgi:hypothetical protein
MEKSFRARLERVPEKGGWTYVVLPFDAAEIFGSRGNIKVTGTIDGYPMSKTTLMPMGGGKHIFAVNSAMRKTIGKEPPEQVSVSIKMIDSGS